MTHDIPSQQVEAGQCWQHVKRGTTYEVIGTAELQMSNDLLVDGSEMVVYRGDDGKLWAREEGEFTDGRFVLATPKPEGETVTDDGWVMVPRKPTQEMIDNAFDFETPEERRRGIWQCMIAASPKQAPVAGEARQQRIDAIWSLLVEADDENRRWTAEKILDALWRGTTMSADPMREALEWYALHVGNCRKVTSEGDDSRKMLDRDRGEKAREALAAAAETVTDDGVERAAQAMLALRVARTDETWQRYRQPESWRLFEEDARAALAASPKPTTGALGTPFVTATTADGKHFITLTYASLEEMQAAHAAMVGGAR